jgi:hypothetical protein
MKPNKSKGQKKAKGGISNDINSSLNNANLMRISKGFDQGGER